VADTGAGSIAYNVLINYVRKGIGHGGLLVLSMCEDGFATLAYGKFGAEGPFPLTHKEFLGEFFSSTGPLKSLLPRFEAAALLPFLNGAPPTPP
jgi:hypothetical protein